MLPGTVLALYIDGLIETRDANLSVGIDRLRTPFAPSTAQAHVPVRCF
ncbi:hypothetical protein ACRJ4B_45660 [Streptomyces sp. GTA36]